MLPRSSEVEVADAAEIREPHAARFRAHACEHLRNSRHDLWYHYWYCCQVMSPRGDYFPFGGARRYGILLLLFQMGPLNFDRVILFLQPGYPIADLKGARTRSRRHFEALPSHCI